MHWQRPATQVPFEQGLLAEQVSGLHVPSAAPEQVADEREQSEAFVHASLEQAPMTGGVHTDVTPQSLSFAQAPPPLTRASADT